MTTIIDGKRIAAEIRQEAKQDASALAQQGVTPCLAVVLVGEDPASKAYVGSKVKACEEVGVRSIKITMDADVAEAELLTKIDELNADAAVHGILVQLPLPKHMDEDRVIEALDPAKDVDGFHPVNVGKLGIGLDCLTPCTPTGIPELIVRSGLPMSGQHAVVIGRSNIVGKPMMNLLVQKGEKANCTVTCCHSGTRDLTEFTRQADIVIAAIGQPEFVTADFVKEGAVVIDVGVNRLEDATKKKGYRLVGDVAYDEVAPKCHTITPVPGGVGPMTIALLMSNTVKAAELLNA